MIKPPRLINYIYLFKNGGLIMKKNVEKIERLRRFLIHIYGEKEGKRRCGNLMKGSSLKVLKFKFGVENGIKRNNELREIDKFKNTLPGFIKRYGEEEGTKKYYEKNSRLSVGTKALKKNGFSDDEILKIKEKHSNGSKTDLDSMVKKYGKEKGTEKYNLKMENHYNPWSYKSIMKHDNLTESEAKKIVSERQKRDEFFFIEKYGEKIGKEKYELMLKKKSFANTKEYYIEKYGEKLGKLKYKQVCYDRGKTSRLEYYVEKYGPEVGTVKYDEMLRKKVTYFPDFSSNIEKEFNTSIYNNLSDIMKSKFHGHPITKPFYLNVDKELYDTVCIVPDIKLGNIVIEFDGDYWHSLLNVIERDMLKDRIYSDFGYFLIRIKESEYLNDKVKILNNVIKLINKNYENKID